MRWHVKRRRQRGKDQVKLDTIRGGIGAGDQFIKGGGRGPTGCRNLDGHYHEPFSIIVSRATPHSLLVVSFHPPNPTAPLRL